ncbi:MAG: Acetoin:2,6-dichlorophenolindophenol oxidoreductase subunit beta [Chlamydiales bacterium]|nr:Acetoin:2,6-dichlorophenolindophenol oxidoreductase subunit beta [Chlamydiales bacterium]MCH9619480.1 Acetoin:2,6-dichlorophenolindophenol oxidoreductase subunit beta [Chlamydiales bacterium]MCH9622284.1 Acetoin:2,6-dichlorophenolindophenol oxidoreductase subunit beta [Chlamydiales bacterium]
MPRELKLSQAINEATDQLMEIDENVYLMGLGVPDPKGVFGTTSNLQEKYGPDRVLDMPVSENAMTGIAVGSAITGMRPVMVHQRVDFFILALDQLINSAAKWHYMFAGKMRIPFVIRLLIGRGWGQGPQHCQTLHSYFAHIPGLKVVAPSNPYNAKGLLTSAIKDDNPVIFLEHRWLHNVHGPVPKQIYEVPLGKAHLLQEGEDITIVSFSHKILEAFKAAKMADDVSVEIVDLQSLRPLDMETILKSVKKTGRVLILDDDWKMCSFASEISARIAEEAFDFLKIPPKRLTCPDGFSPTSWALANHYYPIPQDIVSAIYELVGKPKEAARYAEKSLAEKNARPLDQPDPSFVGPF